MFERERSKTTNEKRDLGDTAEMGEGRIMHLERLHVRALISDRSMHP